MIKMDVKSSGWPKKQDLDDLAEHHTQALSRKIFETCVKLSPVLTGSFRASWRISLNSPDHSVTNWPNVGFPIAGAKFHWPSGFKLGDTVVISNSQPYADEIEHGSSKQAPFGIVRLAVAAAELSFT